MARKLRATRFVPAGALDTDANLRVIRKTSSPAAGENQTLASEAFDSAATLPAAVERVTTVVSSVTGAPFSAAEKEALVEYLKSL